MDCGGDTITSNLALPNIAKLIPVFMDNSLHTMENPQELL